MKIVPTIFAKDKKAFQERFEKLRRASKDIQIDIMDGKFVKSKSINIADIPVLFQYENIFEAHLMVKNPEKYIDELRKKGFGRVIFHIETMKNEIQTNEIIKDIRSHGMQPAIAINPKTDTKILKKTIESKQINHIMLMGVNPGKEKQSINPGTYQKIKSLKKAYPNITIQIDGGVNEKSAPKLWKEGANILNSGSFISESNDPKDAINKLKQIKKD